jgi:DNA-binding transcriptional ArsR family regulator
MAEVKLSAEEFQRIGRAVSDANRWEMLRLIFARPEMTCGEVLSCLPITAGTFSHHLRELEETGLVQTTACGRFKKLTPRREIWEAYLAELKGL